MVTLPRLRLVGFALSAPGVTPVPETGIVNEGSDPLDTMVTVAAAFPLDLGAKVIVKVALWDAARVSGVVMALIENAVLSTET